MALAGMALAGMALAEMLEGAGAPQIFTNLPRRPVIEDFYILSALFTTCSPFYSQFEVRRLLKVPRFAHSRHFGSSSPPQYFFSIATCGCNCVTDGVSLCTGQLLALKTYTLSYKNTLRCQKTSPRLLIFRFFSSPPGPY